MTTSLGATVFNPPLVNPAPGGLFAATLWPTVEGPPRWMGGGERFRRRNYDGAFGVWPEQWCGVGADDSGDGERPRKVGSRPGVSEPFYAVAVWASDECSALSASRQEVRERAVQTLKLREQPAVEREFAGRLLADAQAAGTIQTVSTLAAGVAVLVQALADTGTVGVIHAAAGVEVEAEAAKIVVRSGGSVRAPGGHMFAFGAGYLAGGLDRILVATSPTFGWRTEPVFREGPTADGYWYAMAERSVLIGFEQLVGAVRIGA